jgi:hypothetical protein
MVNSKANRRESPHYHVIETPVGVLLSYRDDWFPSRRSALRAARMRAEWFACMGPYYVVPLQSPAGRYLVTSRDSHHTGCLITVEECDDTDCGGVHQPSMTSCA